MSLRTIMAKNSHETSFSFSRRYFHWRRKIEDEDDDEEILTFNSSSHTFATGKHREEDNLELDDFHPHVVSAPLDATSVNRKKHHSSVSNKLRSAALSVFGKNRRSHSGLGTKVVGTLFGHRRGHVHFAFQEDPKVSPAFLIEIATPTSVLVKEMASGLVRIALECDKKLVRKSGKLLEEPIWRTYCNGRKCGYAMRRECGPEEWKVLKSVEPITMGAGVLPGKGNEGDGSEGEVMYMRAKYERVVGSKDSEAFYMMNPDGNGGPELSVYLLRA